MRIAFRAAEPADYDYCAKLYFAEMEPIIRELNLDVADHAAKVRQLWVAPEVRIIVVDDVDGGWLQARNDGDALFLAQLFVERPLQGRGIGTAVMRHLIDEAAAGRAITLGVVKTNPALPLYKRLGFQTTHEDERKFYMRREPEP